MQGEYKVLYNGLPICGGLGPRRYVSTERKVHAVKVWNKERKLCSLTVAELSTELLEKQVTPISAVLKTDYLSRAQLTPGGRHTLNYLIAQMNDLVGRIEAEPMPKDEEGQVARVQRVSVVTALVEEVQKTIDASDTVQFAGHGWNDFLAWKSQEKEAYRMLFNNQTPEGFTFFHDMTFQAESPPSSQHEGWGIPMTPMSEPQFTMVEEPYSAVPWDQMSPTQSFALGYSSPLPPSQSVLYEPPDSWDREPRGQLPLYPSPPLSSPQQGYVYYAVPPPQTPIPQTPLYPQHYYVQPPPPPQPPYSAHAWQDLPPGSERMQAPLIPTPSTHGGGLYPPSAPPQSWNPNRDALSE